MKNGETSDRLFALEQQMVVLTEEFEVMRLSARQEEIPTVVFNRGRKRSTSRPTPSLTGSLFVFSSLSGRLNLVLKLRLI